MIQPYVAEKDSVTESVPRWRRERPGMIDGYERVTGRVPFASNVVVPRMLHAALLRSDVAHARIVRIDVSRARNLPGVRAVLTAEDIVAEGRIKLRFGPVFRDQPILAFNKVRFIGEPVAAVAAETRDAALAAVDMIDVEYEELPAVFDPAEAMAESAPLLHEEQPELGATFADILINRSAMPNVCNTFKLRRGDIETGFAQCDHVFEDVFTSPAVQHVPLETHCCVASVDRSRITITTGTQIPYMVRGQIAEIFGLPAASVQIVAPPLGGAYGSKCYPTIEPIAAALSYFARRPVRLQNAREEEFVTITKHAARIQIKTGLLADGTIVARKVFALFNTGAYADIGPRLVKNGGYGTNGPVSIPHVWIDSHAVYTNVPPAGAFRGYGIPQAAWAYDTQIDMIAYRLGMSPYELRMKNLLIEGQPFATGEPMRDVHFKELLTTARNRIGWEWPGKAKQEGNKARAKGLSCIIKSTVTPSTSTAAVKLNDDGSLHILTSSVELGQGVHTLLATLASEQLQIPISQISVALVDTDVTPYDQQTSSSRSSYSMGQALSAALDDVRAQLFARAAQLLDADASGLELHGGRVAVAGALGQSLSYAEIIRRTRAGNIMGRGFSQSKGGLDPESGQGVASVHWHQAVGAAEVEVDLETGHIKVLKYHGGVYAGRVINKVHTELQMAGNVAMGIGQALWEELLYDSGQLQNGSLADYMTASFEDMPDEIDINMLESESVNAEVHGIGETSLPAVMPAVGNAVFRATGVRITDLPLTAEKVLRGLKAQEKEPESQPENALSETTLPWDGQKHSAWSAQ